jgi:hypothetical protein
MHAIGHTPTTESPGVRGWPAVPTRKVKVRTKCRLATGRARINRSTGFEQPAVSLIQRFNHMSYIVRVVRRLSGSISTLS